MNEQFKNACNCAAIHDNEIFLDWPEFDNFSSSLLDNLEFVATIVITPYANVGLPEKWYRCTRCGTV